MIEIIKQLEQKRDNLDLKIIKINQAIQSLKELDEEVIYSDDLRLKSKEPQKPKRKYSKRINLL